MKYIKKDLGAYNLHMIKTDKFKSITVRVNFRNIVKKEDITMRNFLTSMLTMSSKKYNTKKDLSIKSQDLYASTIDSSTHRFGNYIDTSITLFSLNDKYTEPGNFKDSVEFLKEIIFNPNVTNKMFDSSSYQIVYETAKATLESIKEQTSYYSVLKMYEVMDKDSPISYRMTGYLEDLSKINTSNLYTYYEKMLKSDLIDIFVLGDIDFECIEDIIKNNFKFNTYKKKGIVGTLEEKKAPRSKKIVKEQIENIQSKLAIGCRVTGLTPFERNYALTLYSIILGGGGNSKLFQTVREQESLAYYISSVPNKLDNILLIRAGISKDNFDKTLKLAEKQMLLMKKGEFNQDDIDKAVQMYITSASEIEESPGYIIESFYMMDLMGTDDIETRKKKIKKVTKEDIINVAKNIKIDTVFLLEGDEQ